MKPYYRIIMLIIKMHTLIAKKILTIVEHSGKVIFPNWKTQWHFDKKVVQKYLLETIKQPLIVEISYGSPLHFYDNCPGYWDKSLNWHGGRYNPQAWMVDGVIRAIGQAQ